MLNQLKQLKVDNHFAGILIHFKNYFTANIAQKALAIISLPVMTRLLLPSEYGVLSVFMSYVGIFVVILSINSYTAIGRYWYEKRDDFKDFMGTSFYLIFSTLFFSFLAVMPFRRILSSMLGIGEALILLLLPFIVINIISSVFRQVFEPQRKSGLIAKLNIGKAYLGFGASVIFMLLMTGERYYGVIWGHLIVGTVVTGVMIKHLLPHFKMVFRGKHLRYILSYSAPLIPYALSGVILAQFDRIMINRYISSDAAGLYSLAYNIGMLLLLMTGALLAAWTPDYFEDMDKQNYQKLDSDIDKLFRLILIGAMLLMLFGQELGLILADKKYHVALGIVPIVVFGYIFEALWQLWGRNIGYARKTIWAPIISFIAGSTNIALNAIFIPLYGYVAGAYTTVASYMLTAFMGWVVSRYIVQLHTTRISIILKPLVLLVIFNIFVLAIASIGWGLWIMIGIKTLLFCLFCVTMMGRYLHAILKIAVVNHPR